MKMFLDILTRAEQVYWLFGVIIMIGGFVIFLVETIGSALKRRGAAPPPPAPWTIVAKEPSPPGGPAPELPHLPALPPPAREEDA